MILGHGPDFHRDDVVFVAAKDGQDGMRERFNCGQDVTPGWGSLIRLYFLQWCHGKGMEGARTRQSSQLVLAFVMSQGLLSDP